MESHAAYDEKGLLSRVAGGDETAFREIYQQYRRRIYSYALNLTESEDQAGEILQEVFLKVWLNRDKLPSVDNFNAWLHTIARNLFFDALKKLAREAAAYRHLRLVTDENSHETETFILNRENQALLHQWMDRLPPRQREIFRLRGEGYKLDEIAEKLGISKDTVKVHLKRALARLKGYLKERPDSTLVLLALLLSATP